MGKKKLLVIGAHSADFVWRAAGTIALITSQGGSATVIALSYGERGESGELWKEPGQTVENVKRIRHEQASAAAEYSRSRVPLFRPGRLSAQYHRRQSWNNWWTCSARWSRTSS